MPKRTVYLTSEGSQMLEAYKNEHPRMSYGEILSVAMTNFAQWDNRDYAQDRIDHIIQKSLEDRIARLDHGLRAMLASAMIDICMLLADVLEERATANDVSVKEDYEDLRQAGLVLFNRKRFSSTVTTVSEEVDR